MSFGFVAILVAIATLDLASLCAQPATITIGPSFYRFKRETVQIGPTGFVRTVAYRSDKAPLVTLRFSFDVNRNLQIEPPSDTSFRVGSSRWRLAGSTRSSA